MTQGKKDDETKRVIPHTGPRVETGVVQFGEDWPGLFIRGDNCMGLLCNLDMVEFALTNPESREWALTHIRNLKELLGEPIGK